MFENWTQVVLRNFWSLVWLLKEDQKQNNKINLMSEADIWYEILLFQRKMNSQKGLEPECFSVFNNPFRNLGISQRLCLLFCWFSFANMHFAWEDIDEIVCSELTSMVYRTHVLTQPPTPLPYPTTLSSENRQTSVPYSHWKVVLVNHQNIEAWMTRIKSEPQNHGGLLLIKQISACLIHWCFHE